MEATNNRRNPSRALDDSIKVTQRHGLLRAGTRKHPEFACPLVTKLVAIS
jgi:hypothetical protein